MLEEGREFEYGTTSSSIWGWVVKVAALLHLAV
jgi:hypothetical protein